MGLPIVSASWPKMKDLMGMPSSVAAKGESEITNFVTSSILGATKYAMAGANATIGR